MNNEELGQSLSQDAVSNLYAKLLDLAPHVDRALPFIHRQNAPPIAAKIKRCLSDLNNKVANKRRQISEGNRVDLDANNEQDQDLGEDGGMDEEVEQADEEVEQADEEVERAAPARRKWGVSVITLQVFFIGHLILLQKATLTTSQIKKSNQIVAQNLKRPEERTPIEFIFEWQGENNGTRREFEGLMRIVLGYVPVDLSNAAESLKLVCICVVPFLLCLLCFRET
jgi:hypothetical protein